MCSNKNIPKSGTQNGFLKSNSSLRTILKFINIYVVLEQLLLQNANVILKTPYELLVILMFRINKQLKRFFQLMKFNYYEI